MTPAKFHLRSGDKVGLYFPGFPCDSAVIRSARDYLHSLDLQPVFKQTKPDLFLAATDEKRGEILKGFYDDDQIRAIWCLRGGYGALRLLPQMLKWRRPRSAKWLIGISDVTSLQLFANQVWQTPCLHAPLLSAIAQQKVDVHYQRLTQQILFGELRAWGSQKLKPLNDKAKKIRTTRGQISGGNLTVYAGHVGGPLNLNGQGKILVFEDLGERAYRTDRCLQQLLQAGKMKNVAGLVFGEFQSVEPKLVNSVLQRFAQSVKFPVWSGLDFGHGSLQLPMIFGHAATIHDSYLQQEWA